MIIEANITSSIHPPLHNLLNETRLQAKRSLCGMEDQPPAEKERRPNASMGTTML